MSNLFINQSKTKKRPGNGAFLHDFHTTDVQPLYRVFILISEYRTYNNLLKNF